MLLRKQVQPCFKRGSLMVKIWIRWILKILALALVAYLWFLNLVSNIQIDPQTYNILLLVDTVLIIILLFEDTKGKRQQSA
jgi:hypothetical protein